MEPRSGDRPPGAVPAVEAGATPAVVPLVIGVTSHRNLVAAEVEVIRQRVGDLLQYLQREFPHSPLVVLSPLAEGGDQLVAEEGLRLGARVIAPLPFARGLYAHDFDDPAARRRFESLCDAAEVIELPLLAGHTTAAISEPGDARDRQYAQAGMFVVRHCHLLVAIWDGKASDRLGGTAQTAESYLSGIPPGGIERRRDRRLRLYGGEGRLLFHVVCSRAKPDGAPVAPLRPGEVIWRSLDESSAPGAPMPSTLHMAFARADAFNSDCARHARRIDERPRDDRPPRGAAAPDEPSPASPAALFRAADWLAVRFQKRVLLALRVIYAVAFLMGMAFNAYDNLNDADDMIYAFLLLFAIGVAISVVARRRAWHRRYLDYRALAEGLRVQDYWRRAGISLSGEAGSGHDSALQNPDTELGWVRNAMRGAALFSVVPPKDDAALRAVIGEWVGDDTSGQLGYYRRRTGQRERAYRLTERIGALCLLVGIAISVFMAVLAHHLSFDAKNDLIIAMGAFSIFAAVREAYSFRKADRELIRQYHVMERVFGNARKALDHVADADEQREILRALGEAALAEHVEWAVVHRQRPLQAGKM